MKTLFITSFHPLISRNILLPILPHLAKEKKLKVALFVSRKKWKYFSEVFERGNAALEGIRVELSFMERLLRYFSLAALDTKTIKIKRKTEMRGSGLILSRFIAGRNFNQKILQFMSRLFTPAGNSRAFFDKYKPDLVFSTDIQNEYDLRLLHFAKRRGVKTIAMIRSWDNPTSKGLLRFIPDILLVQNEIAKKELEKFHGVPAEKILVIGIPHYDFYFRHLSVSRKTFFDRLCGDASKKTVLFAPTGDRYLRGNAVDREVLEILNRSLPSNVQILVRLPPTDTVSDLEGRKLEGRIIYDRPSSPFRTPKKTEISQEAEEHLKASLYYADLIVSGPSTIAIDAVFFGKPVVLVGFDGYKHRSYYESVRRYYDYNHWGPVLSANGLRLAESIRDFTKCVNEYLEKPSLDEAGRKRIVREQICFVDGASSKRLADVLCFEL